MENQQSTETSQAKQPIEQPIKSTQLSKVPLTIMIMTVITSLSLMVAGYLGYQNYLLKQQLSEIKNTPTAETDPTADWILFTNTTYKYSLKYPPGWTVKAKANLDPTTYSEPVFDLSCDYEAGDLCQQFFVDAVEATSSSDLEPSFIVQDDDVVTEKQNIKIDGQNAVSFVYRQTNSGSTGLRLHYVVVTNFNGYKYTIFYEESQKGKEFKTSSDWNNKQLFDKVLSTFKFLEPENSTSNLSDKKIGYIKSISSNYDNYSIEVDYINFIQENTAPNGYRIENPSTETVSLSTGTHGSEPLITMQTYSYDSSGNFNFNQKITFSEFLNKFKSDSNFKAVPFWIETKNGIVVQITEQYIP